MLATPLVAAALAFFCRPSIAVSLTELPSPTVSLYVPGVTSDDYTAAAIAAQPSATTYLVGCFTFGDFHGDCAPLTIAQGAKSYSMGWAQGGTWTEKLECVPEGTASLACKVSNSRYLAAEATATTTTTTKNFSGTDVNFVPVTITAGQQMVTSAANAGAPRAIPWAAGGGAAMAAVAAVAV